ncbi:MAG: NERD domain-containing protein, partial [Clostridia bacterium]|nr:NERD domain-containing protein [Clostridia bacterium]
MQQIIQFILKHWVIIAISIALAVSIAKLIDYRSGQYFKVTGKPFLAMRADLGSYGEYLTYKHLKRYEELGAQFLFNVYVPSGEGKTTEIDVLMITSFGIFVFESKNYSGWIFGNENSRNWTQCLPSQGQAVKEHFYNPIMQNKGHIKNLKKLTGDVKYWSIITFSDRCTLKEININSPDVDVINRSRVKDVVQEIIGAQRERRLDIEEVYRALLPYANATEEEKQQHIEDVLEAAENGVAKRKSTPARTYNEAP